jgi:hypothetical protein
MRKITAIESDLCSAAILNMLQITPFRILLQRESRYPAFSAHHLPI